MQPIKVGDRVWVAATVEESRGSGIYYIKPEGHTKRILMDRKYMKQEQESPMVSRCRCR